MKEIISKGTVKQAILYTDMSCRNFIVNIVQKYFVSLQLKYGMLPDPQVACILMDHLLKKDDYASMIILVLV